MSQVYDPEFYAGTHDGSKRSADAMVPLLIEFLGPRSVVDVGCGSGAWLRSFHEAGIEDLAGLDGPWATPLDKTPFTFIPVDLARPFGLSRSFDLVTSLEVAEHLPADAAAAFVESLTKLGSVVLFSAAIPYQGGSHHVNEQWPDYWAALFKVHGYVPVDCIRSRLWANDSVEWWYLQNTILYVAQDQLTKLPQLQRESHFSRLAIVHPRAYLQQVSRLQDAYLSLHPERLPASKLIAITPRVLWAAARRRWSWR